MRQEYGQRQRFLVVNKKMVTSYMFGQYVLLPVGKYVLLPALTYVVRSPFCMDILCGTVLNLLFPQPPGAMPVATMWWYGRNLAAATPAPVRHQPLPPIMEAGFVETWQISFQNAATTMMEGIIDLHHDIMAFLILIIIFVLLLMVNLLASFVVRGPGQMLFFSAHGITHNTVLETVWTIIPTFILLLIATPSFALVYALDEVVDPDLTIRVVGRQWYWTYEYPDSLLLDSISPVSQAGLLLDSASASSLKIFDLSLWDTFVHFVAALQSNFPKSFVDVPGFAYNSYLVATEDLSLGSLRLLETDRRLVLPVQTNVRLLITSYDVIHSWAVPAFGVKVDALPGRLNEYFLNVQYLGTFYGQCSEICGVNHGFMPIKVAIVTPEYFRWWFIITAFSEVSYNQFHYLCVDKDFSIIHILIDLLALMVAQGSLTRGEAWQCAVDLLSSSRAETRAWWLQRLATIVR
jgi:cytochrome c oxidase subunit II